MPTDQPSNWDIVHRLAEVEKDHKDLQRRHDDDIKELQRGLSDAKDRGDATYLRKETWGEARKADAAVVANVAEDVQGLRDDRKADTGWRRQVLLGLSLAAIASMTSIAIAVFTLLARSS